MRKLLTERIARQALIAIALAGLVLGALAWANGSTDLANWCWATGTVPVIIALFFSMLRDFLAGRFGVDSIAFVSMAAALLLGQNLAGIIIAIMYAGGNVLEDFRNRASGT
jgi:cation transport ATPase